MAGGHRHLTYTWRVYHINLSNIAPLDLFSHLVTSSYTTTFHIFPFSLGVLAQTSLFFYCFYAAPLKSRSMVYCLIEFVEHIRLLLAVVDISVQHTLIHLAPSPLHTSAP